MLCQTDSSAGNELDKDSALQKALGFSINEDWPRRLSDDSLLFKVNPIGETLSLSNHQRNSFNFSFSNSLGWISRDNSLGKNLSVESLDKATKVELDQEMKTVKAFIDSCQFTEDELISGRKNLTKNWVFKLRQLIQSDELDSYHKVPSDLTKLRNETNECGFRVSQMANLFKNRTWLSNYFFDRIFRGCRFELSLINSDKLTQKGKYIMLQSISTFKYGILNPDIFTEWSKQKMMNRKDILALPENYKELTYEQLMERMIKTNSVNSKMTDQTHTSQNSDHEISRRRQLNQNLTKYWVIAISHLIQGSDSRRLIERNTSKDFKLCLKGLRKCGSIPKFKQMLRKYPWLRRYLTQNQSEHLIKAVAADIKINDQSKRRLFETFPIMVNLLNNPSSFRGWSNNLSFD